MSANLCFENVIGLSRTEDLCVDGWDASYSESKSGIFLDELQGMSLRILDAVGGKNDIWTMMNNAVQNGINTFKTDIFPEVLKYNQYRREKFQGEIGHPRFTVPVAKSLYHGMKMFSDIRGGVFTLRGVTLNLNSTENVDLLIFDEYQLLYTIPVSSSAGKPKKTVITAIELPLNGIYYFLYTPVGTPYNNKMTCGCGGYRWCFDPFKPCYNSSRENWTLWAMAGGVHGDVLIDRDAWGVSEYAQGLRLHGDFKCDAMQMLCTDASDFANNEIDSAIAWAILYKAAEFLTFELKNSTEVSRNNLLGDEDILAYVEYYSARYTVLINFIAENIEPSRNECLKCRSAMGISRVSQKL